MILLLTGQSGAGKTTLANQMKKMYMNSIVLDGDVLRDGLNSDLGFSDNDIMENMRRTSSLAKLLSAQGYFVIISMIAPLKKGRDLFRGGADRFFEVLVKQKKCEERDVKGLYKKNTPFRQYENGNPDYIINVDGKNTLECVLEIECNTWGSEKSNW